MRALSQIAIVAGLAALLGGCSSSDTTGQPVWTAAIDADDTASGDISMETDGETTGDGGLDAATDDGGGTPDFTDPVISAAFYHVCAVRRSGNVQCWGWEQEGELGYGGVRSGSTTPVSVEGIATATDVATGRRHTCSVLKSGETFCWGSGDDGRLGPDRETSATPVEVREVPGSAVEVVAGRFHSCALLEDGRVLCWGGFGAHLGKIPEGTDAAPIEVAELAAPSALAAGDFHNCAVVRGGEVECWGDNRWNQLGNADEDSSSSPVPVEVEGITSATEVAAGRTFSCALLERGNVQCWGGGEFGELGHGSTTGSATPVEVQGVRSAAEVSGGRYHVCAVLESGAIRCWGRGHRGQLGNGKTGGSETGKREDDYRSATPVEVEDVSSAVDVAAGGRHTCALLESGEARCWGHPSVHGKRPNSAVPVEVKFE